MTRNPRYRAYIFNIQQRPRLAMQVQRFRKNLFVDKLGWNLETIDGCERDQFDNHNSVYLALFDGSQLVATFRATRTDQPYLARNIFSGLDAWHVFPTDSQVWEISRFGVADCGNRKRVSQLNYGLMFIFAQARKAKSLVAIGDRVYERYLQSIGIRTKRFGPPTEIGRDHSGQPLEVIAGEIPLLAQSPNSLDRFSKIKNYVEIHDEAFLVGPERVSA